MLLPDVQTAALQPEILTPQTPPVTTTTTTLTPTPVDVPSEPVKETKQEELLLTTEEENEIEQVQSNAAHILEDLTDIQFEQHEQIKKEKEEFDSIKNDIDEAASKIYHMPL